MDTYAHDFPLAHVGYSGHELGIYITLAAVARGARVIERHVTLNRKWKGSDHACSLEPHDLRELVRAVRAVEASLGSPLKAFQPLEEPCYLKLGKSIVAKRFLRAGEILQEEDLEAKVSEPKGVPAQRLEFILGKMLTRDADRDESIFEDDLV